VSDLMRIAVGQAQAEDTYGARDTMKFAVTACKEIEDPEAQADVWIRIAETQNKIGESRNARKAAEAAGEVIATIEDTGKQGKLLARLAQVMAAGEDPDAAAEVLADAEKRAGEIEAPLSRATALCRVAQGYKQIERTEEAARVIGELTASSGAIEDARIRCDVFTEIAVLQNGMGMGEESGKSFDLAIAAAEVVPASGDLSAEYGQAYSLCQIATKLLDMDSTAKAAELVAKAEKLLPSIPSADLQEQVRQTVRKLKRQLPDAE